MAVVLNQNEAPPAPPVREARAKMFALAVIYAAGSSAPVRVRNLSAKGALIEGAALPSEGANARLCRGSLEVRGRIVWRRDGKAGIRFDEPVDAAAWLSGGPSGAAQRQADRVVHDWRSSGGHMAWAPAPAHLQASKAEPLDFMRVSRALDALADELAADPAIIGRFGEKLLMLDVASQHLRRAARTS